MIVPCRCMITFLISYVVSLEQFRNSCNIREGNRCNELNVIDSSNNRFMTKRTYFGGISHQTIYLFIYTDMRRFRNGRARCDISISTGIDFLWSRILIVHKYVRRIIHFDLMFAFMVVKVTEMFFLRIRIEHRIFRTINVKGNPFMMIKTGRNHAGIIQLGEMKFAQLDIA